MGLFEYINKSKIAEFNGISGPSPSFPLGNLLSFVGENPWETIAGFSINYGEICLVWFGSSPHLIINSPDLFREVLETNWTDYYKDSPKKALEPVITSYSPFLANPPAWKSMRDSDSFSSPWSPKWISQQVLILKESIKLRTNGLAKFSSKKSLDLTHTIQKMSFDSFSISVSGKILPESIYDIFTYMGKVGADRLTSLFVPKYIPSVFFYWKRRKWFSYFSKLVKEVESNPNPNSSDLINWIFASGSKYSDKGTAINLANVFYGGVYSVTSVLVTAIWLLSQIKNKHFEEKLKLEIKETFNKDNEITFKEIEEMSFLDKVVRESMRIFPPVPLYLRNSSKSKVVKLGKNRIPPNTPILISNYALHHSDVRWENPLEFNPERWTKDVITNNPYGSDYFFPFGRGPRACMGMSYALINIKLTLASFYSIARFEPDLKSNYVQGFFFGVMMPQTVTGKIVLDE